jgi:hypothetical protein
LVLPPNIEPYRDAIEFGRGAKKNYAQNLSAALALKFANALRRKGFKGVLPHETGKGGESHSAVPFGSHRIDVNYSNSIIGLGLAISIKTINFKDEGSSRFTKNMRRADKELREEAEESHKYYRYASLSAVVLLPVSCATDSSRRSSLKHAEEVFSPRAGRNGPEGDLNRFERVFLGVYDTSEARFGDARFMQLGLHPIPHVGLPSVTLSLSQVLDEIEVAFRERRPKA